MESSEYRARLHAMALVLAAALLVGCDTDQTATTVESEVPAQSAPDASTKECRHGDAQPAGTTSGSLEIDLSLPADTFTLDEDLVLQPPHSEVRLPNLFEEVEKERRTSVNAELLRDEHNPDVVDSIEGMNLTIERKLGE